MTHDERIEAMALALYDHAVGPDFPPFDRLPAAVQLYWVQQATAALAAAGIEEMVREAADEGFEAGFLCVYYETQEVADTVDAIVREVMGR
jgi:hypothetical protein